MDEKDRVGVMVVLETGIATATALSGTPWVASLAGVAPLMDYYLGRSVDRRDNVTNLVEDTIDLAGATPEELLDWVKADHRHLALFHGAVEAAWSTFERVRVRALSRVLADGFTNSARIDPNTLVVKAVRDLDEPHLRVLALIASRGLPPAEIGVSRTGLTTAEIAEHLPELGDACGPILSVLERHGCVRSKPLVVEEEPYAWRQHDRREWFVESFGVRCLGFFADAT